MKVNKIVKNLLAVILIMIITVLVTCLNVGYSLDIFASDALCQKPSVTNKNIYIVAIDDKTLEKYGRVSAWSREIPAKLVETLNVSDTIRPTVITFDIIYSEEGIKEEDDKFADVCRKAGNVIMAMSYNFKEQPDVDENNRTFLNKYYVENEILPYKSLRESVDYGFANTIVGNDGCVRRAMAYVDNDGERLNSLSVETYNKYMSSIGEEAVMPALDKDNQFLFAYSGESGAYSIVSMADVLEGKIDCRIFKDAIVLVGAYAVGMQDSYVPAISHGSQMYGVEIHANIIEALLEGKTQQNLPVIWYAIAIAIIAAAFYLIIKKIKIVPSTILLFVLILLDILFAKWMFSIGYVTKIIILPIILIIIYAENMIYGYVQEIMRRKKVVNVFKQYVAPQIVDKISKDRDFEIVLGGENRHIACLFVDIRGFTTMSESLKPEEVVEILNEYLSLTTKSIFDNGGTLDKFVGDATMAVFNAPFDLEDYIYKAVCCARDMKAGADDIAEKFEKRFGKSVAFGIGINCGDAVVGNIGCDFRMDYTAIGDTVNTAARLESNAARGQILISEAVYEAVKDRVEVTPIGEIPLKGKSQGVFVYQLDKVK